MIRVPGSISSAILMLHEFDPGRTFGCQALDALGTAVPYDCATFDVVDLETHQCQFDVRPATMGRPEWTWETYARYLPQNPYYQYVRQTGDASAHRLSEFVSEQELRRTGLFSEVFEPAGIRFQIAMGLPARRPAVVGLSLSRSRRDFTHREADQLNALRPHLIQAYRSARRIAAYERALRGVTEVLAEAGQAVLVLGDDFPLRDDQKAARLIGRYFAAPPDGTLPAQIADWLAEEQVNRRSGGGSPIRSPLVSRQGPRRLAIRFIPGTDERADMLVLDERREDGDASSLQSLGLTVREAEVTGWLVRGKSLDQIAKQLAISPNTVRTHVERVYRKLGVSSRASATALVLDALHTDRDLG